MSLSRPRPLHLPHRYHQHPPKQLQTPSRQQRLNLLKHLILKLHRRDKMMLLLFQQVEHNLPVTSIHLQHRGLLQGVPLLPLLDTLQGLEDLYLQELPSQLLQSHLDHPPLQAASKAMGLLLQCLGRCMVAIMVIMENTQIAEQLILLASTHLHPGIPEHSTIIKMVHTEVEEILGMVDMKDSLQRIVIQTTSTESLSQNDPAPEPVSTLTGPHPGKAILMSTREQTEVPTMIIMQISPSTMIMEHTITDSMTRATEDTMISPTGLVMMMATEAETATIINSRILPGKRAMMISGGTILAMMPVLMKITGDVETATTLTDAASTASSRHTACTAPTATTADEAASAHDHNRARYTEASLI